MLSIIDMCVCVHTHRLLYTHTYTYIFLHTFTHTQSLKGKWSFSQWHICAILILNITKQWWYYPHITDEEAIHTCALAECTRSHSYYVVLSNDKPIWLTKSKVGIYSVLTYHLCIQTVIDFFRKTFYWYKQKKCVNIISVQLDEISPTENTHVKSLQLERENHHYPESSYSSGRHYSPPQKSLLHWLPISRINCLVL